MDALGFALTSPRMRNIQLVQDDDQFQIVYGVICPISFQSVYEFLVHYQNKDLQAH